MCSGSKSKLFSPETLTEGELRRQKEQAMSGLLEFAACDDLTAFRREVEEKGLGVDESGFWYCRRVGSNKMGFEERTPLMVAAMYGSTEILKYIISTGKADVNRVCGQERVTALHCAVAGCAWSVVEVIKILLDASAVSNCVDANGNKPSDLVALFSRFVTTPKRKAVELLLRGGVGSASLVDYVLSQEKDGEDSKSLATPTTKYPADASLPDINQGIYGTDEFRMYSFKVKPCSRAYSHDWTECPFVHPGENARRRDPRKYPYTCVPCPEFRKGSCPKGDSCEYAHGVFESWLHPAQYKTRLCKDETGCARKVCFFAHKPEELRPVNASTGSAMFSPRSNCSQTPVSSMDMSVMSPLTLGSSSALSYSSSVSTPPISPLNCNGGSLSPRNGGLWQNRVNNLNVNVTPPALQLPSSRLKSALNARDFDIEMELRLLGLDNQNGQMGFGSFDSFSSSMASPRQQSLSSSTLSQLQSPSRISQISQNMSYHPSSPARKSQQPAPGFDTSAAVAAAVMNSRSSAFAKRSMSFKPTAPSSNLSDWGSPNGKLEWGMQVGDELNKLRRSVSFGIRGNSPSVHMPATARDYSDEPDVSWVNSLVKDSAVDGARQLDGQPRSDSVAWEKVPSWAEQMYREHEQIVA
ncbi:PREDICTED: zinc finger CCCH domain-containing protein 47-like [Tarenaya hassleriana]|uniref:zinc finger CCCH domain-containing protein 47-like n=1 Tax=Tarenaya hassleriana TaxID=28532 RepID=UPI00053C1BCE|nr:PREDICTED: zinc finger CCCH domain-containing protein 47-like [Tarenaya hassleriana]